MRWKWIKRQRAWWCAVCLGLLLAACATPQKIAGGATGAFDRAGRFSLNVIDNTGQPQAVQGGFAWSDDGRELQLDLANPLGSTLARVQVTPGYATLTRADGTQKQARDPDALVELVLGSPMPVAGLRDWLRGQTGRQPVQEPRKNNAGQLVHFVQNGWQVELSRYDALGPRLLQLNHNDAGRRISVRLVIDSD